MSNNLQALSGRRSPSAFLGLSPALAMVGIFLIIPLAFVVAYSLMEASPYGGVNWVLSGEAYSQLLFITKLDGSFAFNSAYLMIALRSVGIALATTVLTLILAFPVAVFLAMQPANRRNILILLITIPFWANILVRTYCWILILRDSGLLNQSLLWLNIINQPLDMLYTDGAILVGLVYTYAPFMVLPIYSTIEKMDLSMLEAAHDLYAGKLKALRRVVWPVARPGILAGSILTFIPSLGALVAPLLLGGGKQLMLGSLIHKEFTEFRDWPFGSALSLALLAIVMLIIMIFALRARDDASVVGGV